MKDRLMAFWRYDTFPFCLCGEITKMEDDGRAETREYGKGFTPIKIVPYAAGVKIKKELSFFKDEYQAEILKINEKYLSLIKEKYPFILKNS